MNLTVFDFTDDRILGDISPRDVLAAVPAAVVPGKPRVLLFDEIGSAVGWDRWLKQAVDLGDSRIVATDSASSLLLEGGRESGAGRWDEFLLEGLTFPEFEALSGEGRGPNPLEQYLGLGGFPEHAGAPTTSPRIRERIRADIADRAVLRDLYPTGVDVRRVKDLLVYLLQSSGSIFSAAKVGRDMEADLRSLTGWRQLLADAHLVVPLRRFAGGSAGRLRGHERIYAVDHGLVVAFAACAHPQDDPTVRARLFEATVFRHLRSAFDVETQISYFRRSDALEADFVVGLGDRRAAIEVKSSRAPTDADVKTLRRAADEVNAKRRLLVYDGRTVEQRGDVTLVPLISFVRAPERIFEGFTP